MNLDDVERFRQIDASDMLGYIDALPDQLAQAWEHAHRLDLPPEFARVRQVVLCGMGGSAISGDLLAALVRDTCRVPVIVNREYDLPAYVVGAEALIITLSHSGGTEETIAAARQGIERGGRLLAITTGGALAPLVEEAGGTVWRYDYRSQPRAALGWLYGLLLGAFSRLGLAEGLPGEVQETVALLERGREVLGAHKPAALNPAKRTAGQMVGRIPIFWGAGLLAPVARRWKTQFNENSKSAAYYEELPELDHNSVVGLDFPEQLMSKIAIIELVSERYDHPRVALRQRASYDLLLQAGIMADRVEARGESRLAQQMSLIQFGDYMSYYVAMAYGVDPTPVENIRWLKEQLAQAG